jgi:hypothetical protein
MYLITFVTNTTPEHADHGKVGEAYVTCWIDRETEEEAIEVASDMIVSDGWEVVRVEEVSTVTEANYDEDDEYRGYYEQALTDKEVVLFHVCPMFPVFYLSFEIAPASEGQKPCEARAWVSNEIVDEDYDPMELDFWTGERLEKTIALVTDTIAENGFKIVRIMDQHPCRHDETSEDCQFFDDAEENGLCIVIIQEENDECA